MVGNLSYLDAALGGLMATSEGQPFFGDCLEKLNGFILYSEADNLQVR